MMGSEIQYQWPQNRIFVCVRQKHFKKDKFISYGKETLYETVLSDIFHI